MAAAAASECAAVEAVSVAAELGEKASSTLAAYGVLALSALGEKASATLAAYGVLAAALPLALEPNEQAVQHYSRTWPIAAVAAEAATRPSATVAVLVVSFGWALAPQRL